MLTFRSQMKNASLNPMRSGFAGDFHRSGFVVKPGFLGRRTLARINAVLDAEPYGWDQYKFHFLNKPAPFLDLISDKAILSICDQWIHPQFRFDHAWGVQFYPGRAARSVKAELHGGPRSDQGFFDYAWDGNGPRCLSLLFALVLEPQKAGDGGLVLVPGSHRRDFRVKAKSRLKPSDLLNPELNAGDLLIFTEALWHGTSPWLARGRRRRILYFKYCAGFATWSDPSDPHGELKVLQKAARTAVERRLFRGPYVGEFRGTRHSMRETTIAGRGPR
jgi:hypothetical protein